MSERLTVAQALVRFLAAQEVERDGVRQRFFAGCWGIFGHGNLAGIGQALRERRDLRPTTRRATSRPWCTPPCGYATPARPARTFACTSSVGPGATNMVTGAAARDDQPPAGAAAARRRLRHARAAPGLQQLEAPHGHDVSVNDCFRPVSRYFDRISRPEQLVPARARGDARAHRPRRDRRRDARAPRRTCRPRRSRCRTRSSSRACGRVAGARPTPAALARAAELDRAARAARLSSPAAG